MDGRRYGLMTREFATETAIDWFWQYFASCLELWQAASRAAPAAQIQPLDRDRFERIVRTRPETPNDRTAGPVVDVASRLRAMW